MALELDRLDEDFDRADPEHGTPQAYELVDQVRLDLGKRIELIEVEEANHYEALVLVLAEHVQSNIVQGQGHRSSDILRVLRDKLQELLYVLGTCREEHRVVYVHDDLLKVVILFLPL